MIATVNYHSSFSSHGAPSTHSQRTLPSTTGRFSSTSTLRPLPPAASRPCIPISPHLQLSRQLSFTLSPFSYPIPNQHHQSKSILSFDTTPSSITQRLQDFPQTGAGASRYLESATTIMLFDDATRSGLLMV